jgi:ABC-type dipeptide/oligopeptide/nickel transport system permease subunit
MSDPVGVPTSEISAEPPAVGEARERTAGLWSDAWRELRRNPVFVISGLVTLLVISMAAFPQLWTRAEPDSCIITRARQRPSSEHIFGFGVNGCDYYAQVVYGARPSVVIAVVATAGTFLLGGIFGILSGYYGGLTDTLISRLTDIVLGLPFLLGAVVFLSVFPNRSISTIAITLIILGWTTITRIMRSSVLTARNMDFVQAAKSLGASDRRVIFRHILPNSIAPVIVYMTIALGAFVAAEATLSFLGVGLVPPDTSWGILISQGDNYALVEGGEPHLLLIPAAFLAATVLSFILLGDALRDALDPKLR